MAFLFQQCFDEATYLENLRTYLTPFLVSQNIIIIELSELH